MFQDVKDFHNKFELPIAHKPALPNKELLAFRLKFLKEEVCEFEKAVQEQNLPEMFDALLDLVYVAIGTALILGCPWQWGWEIVHYANMEKRRAQTAAESKRDSSYDVVKPPKWRPPNIKLLLQQHGWDGK